MITKMVNNGDYGTVITVAVHRINENNDNTINNGNGLHHFNFS